MKKVYKALLVSAFVLLILPVVTTSANTSDKISQENTDVIREEMFADYYTSVFNDISKSHVLNNYNEDITSQFYFDNYNSFLNNDFEKIREYIVQNVSSTWIDETDYSFGKRGRAPFVQCPVSRRYYEVLRRNTASGDIEYYIQGSFIWDRATGRITSIGNASIRITKLTFGAGWSTNLTNMSVGNSITQSNTVANFRGSFTINAIFTYNFFPFTKTQENFNLRADVSSAPF